MRFLNCCTSSSSPTAASSPLLAAAVAVSSLLNPVDAFSPPASRLADVGVRAATSSLFGKKKEKNGGSVGNNSSNKQVSSSPSSSGIASVVLGGIAVQFSSAKVRKISRDKYANILASTANLFLFVIYLFGMMNDNDVHTTALTNT